MLSTLHTNGHNKHSSNGHSHNGKHSSHEDHDDMGDDHVASSVDTPLRADAFDLDDTTKIGLIADHFREIMHILGMDLTDDSLKGTPLRVAKMYVQESFSGLNPENKPEITLFENKYQYRQMLVEK
ncbi:MAG: GTP cyclohydrolase I FolE, partial [Bacteroidetes bacterium]